MHIKAAAATKIQIVVLFLLFMKLLVTNPTMKYFLSLIILWWYVAEPVCAEGLRISVRLASAPERKVLLTHYYGGNIFVDDTLYTDSEGSGVFQKAAGLPQGLYKIFLDQERHFDFLLGSDQTLDIVNPSFNLDGLKITGSEESREFLDYMKWLREQQQRLNLLDSARVKAPEEGKKAIDLQIRELTAEVTRYWKEKSSRYPGTFLSRFLMANYYEELKPEDIPAEYAVNDSLKWTYEYNYRKNHYFDYFDLRDERLLYTPMAKSKLDTYFEKVLLQMYDSVKPAAYALLHHVEQNPSSFRFVTSYLLNSSLNSKVMGMDALFVDIARDYYLSGKAVWADSTTLAKVRENVLFLENNLIGHPAKDLRMETLDGQPFRLYQHNNPYLIVVFFEPNCSHCKEFIPRLYNEVYLPYRDKGLEVVAGYTMNDRKEWMDFISEHQLTDWINVWDEHHLSRFKILYDTRTTPSVYLLDRDKKIIAKKFSIDFLVQYFAEFLGNTSGS